MDVGENRWVVFYDGDCGMCARSVQWILRHDQSGAMFFSPLQGETALGLPADLRQANALETLVVAQQTAAGCLLQVSTYSDAVVVICQAIGGPWRPLGKCISWIPRGMRDYLYRWVARRRHRFAVPQACRLLSESDRRRFLP
jgi:predicted DCC family thiol-disulfide oxidoreductase YuxK